MSSNALDPKVIINLPLDVLRTLPAAQPPPGIQPDFINPQSQVPAVVGIGAAFLALAFFCFSIRIYTKFVITRNWKWDDLTCSLGYTCSIVYFVAVAFDCLNGATGKHMWDVHLDKIFQNSSRSAGYILTVIITPALGFIKSSLFIQYYLLFRPLRWIRICVWTGATISAIFYTVVTIVGFVLESPWPGESARQAYLSSHSAKFALFSVPTGVIGMLVDWYLLILPIPAVLALQTSAAKKLGILVIFMTGGLAAIASIANLYYRVQLQRNPSDVTWKISYILLWAQIEMFAGVAASSMPTVHQFFVRQQLSPKSWISSLLFSLNSTAKEKLPDYNRDSATYDSSHIKNSSDKGGYRLQDLESGGHKGKVTRTSRGWDSQICLTQDESVAE